MSQTIPSLTHFNDRKTASTRKLFALALGHGLLGAAVLCAAYAVSHIAATGVVDCGPAGALLLAVYGAMLGGAAVHSAEANLD